MASAYLRPLFKPHALGLGLSLSLATVYVAQQRPIRLDSNISATPSNYTSKGSNQVPLGKYRLNSRAVRQISSGSIIGLCAGLVVSSFSRSLALLIGLVVLVVQWAASKGIDVIPYKKLQSYVTTVNLSSMVQENVAFKLSFGMTFAMAAFVQF